MAEVKIPFEVKMNILRRLIGAGIFLFFGPEFTENRAVLLDFDNNWTLKLGAIFLPLISIVSHLLSGEIFDWELALSQELYPGQLSCRY